MWENVRLDFTGNYTVETWLDPHSGTVSQYNQRVRLTPDSNPNGWIETQKNIRTGGSGGSDVKWGAFLDPRF